MLGFKLFKISQSTMKKILLMRCVRQAKKMGFSINLKESSSNLSCSSYVNFREASRDSFYDFNIRTSDHLNICYRLPENYITPEECSGLKSMNYNSVFVIQFFENKNYPKQKNFFPIKLQSKKQYSIKK